MFDTNDDEIPKFSINKTYADSYGKWREKEELQKLKDKYGDNDNNVNDASSETSSDDLDPEDLNPMLEKKFLTVLSALKSRDSSIYNSTTKFFDDVQLVENSSASDDKSKKVHVKKDKPLFLKDYERKVIVEKRGDLPDEEELAGASHFDCLPYVEQQKRLKENFTSDLQNDNSEDDDDLLVPREKTNEEKVKEEEEYIKWLKGEKKKLSEEDDTVSRLKPLHDYWNDPSLGDGERFLKDFILNKRYMDEAEEESSKIPTYNEIVDDERCTSQQGENLDEDEKMLAKQDDFEHKYNFRFEEPDEDFIKSYPRTIKDSLRRKEDKNKMRRDFYKERKEKEKQQKCEEIKRLKNLKRKEIANKLKKIKEIVGDDDLTLDPDEFERDFDPAEYDKKMKELFSDKYYDKTETKKPKFSDSSDVDYDEDDPGQRSKRPTKSPENPSTSDANNLAVEKPDEEVRFKDRKRKRSKHVDAGDPSLDPKEKTFEQHFDEYYKLDYDDIIGGGDTLCRFKYRQVTPNDFGLSIEEILKAKPSELNSWVSVKRMSQYRSEKEEKYDVLAYKKKADDERKRRRILYSVYHKGEDDIDADKDVQSTSNSKKDLQKNPKFDPSKAVSNGTALVSGVSQEGPSKKRRKRKNKNANDANKPANICTATNTNDQGGSTGAEATGSKGNSKPLKRDLHFNAKNKPAGILSKMDDERLKAYGINPKKMKNKLKYKK